MDKMTFRANSPPFEGGESLCEFYLDPSEGVEQQKQLTAPSIDTERNAASHSSCIEENIVCCEGNLPSRSFLSLLSQDLLPSSTFTQTFLHSILSSVDSTDPVVSNAWMETLLDVIDLLPNEVVKDKILTLAVNKGQMTQPVTSRLLCCKMLGKMCLNFDPYVIKKEVLPVVLSLCQDVDFEVRGFMCRQLDVVAKGIGLEAIKSAILPELVELANDEETFVRVAAIETVVRLISLLDDDTCTQIVIPLIKKLCENSLSAKDRTLPIVARQLGPLCFGLKDNVSVEQKQWFLNYFTDLASLGLSSSPTLCPMPDLVPVISHTEQFQECRFACAHNFPAMVLFGGPELFERYLFSTLQSLCIDPFQGVRYKMACGFYEVVRLLGSNAYLLLNELVALLQDDYSEVLKGLLPFLSKCLTAICAASQETDKSKLVKAIVVCEEASALASNWRVHADLLSCLACLHTCFPCDTIYATFVPLLFEKLHTARPIPCRTAAAYSLLVFLRNSPSLERRRGIIHEIIAELCYGRSCHKRMLFIKVCELVMELFSKMFFKIHFFKPLLSLSSDRIVNIRLRLCSMLPRLKSLLVLPKDGALLQLLESSVRTLMAEEKDRDIKHYIGTAIEELDKIELMTENASRRSSHIEILLDMEDQFKENEERHQLEKEFNENLLQHDEQNTLSSLPCDLTKTAKIPVLRNGTLPKPSKSRTAVQLQRNSFSGHSKSLRLLKKERRISNPLADVEFQRNLPQDDRNSILKTNTLKCNVPKRPESPNIRTWPRRKAPPSLSHTDHRSSPLPRAKFTGRVSCIPSAPSPKPQSFASSLKSRGLSDLKSSPIVSTKFQSNSSAKFQKCSDSENTMVEKQINENSMNTQHNSLMKLLPVGLAKLQLNSSIKAQELSGLESSNEHALELADATKYSSNKTRQITRQLLESPKIKPHQQLESTKFNEQLESPKNPHQLESPKLNSHQHMESPKLSPKLRYSNKNRSTGIRERPKSMQEIKTKIKNHKDNFNNSPDFTEMKAKEDSIKRTEVSEKDKRIDSPKLAYKYSSAKVQNIQSFQESPKFRRYSVKISDQNQAHDDKYVSNDAKEQEKFDLEKNQDIMRRNCLVPRYTKEKMMSRQNIVATEGTVKLRFMPKSPSMEGKRRSFGFIPTLNERPSSTPPCVATESRIPSTQQIVKESPHH